MSAFDELSSIRPRVVWDGMIARPVHGERLTLAVVELDADMELPEHHHANEQLGLVLQGSVELRVGDETRMLGPGETWRFAPHAPHSGRAGPDGAVVVDAFSPPREDWRELAELDLQPPIWP
ncbi:MAG: cupin domain-containing protein [Solirubrobacteraceae bacterium]